VYWYLLLEWGYDRRRCQEVIAHAGLPVPPKSSCFFCPASKKHEIAWLADHHPELLKRALEIERNAQPNLTSVKGLGRSFAWESFLPRRTTCRCSAGRMDQPDPYDPSPEETRP
jgi:hypothetical protein